MEKIKSLLKKSNTFNCSVRLYCRTYSSIFAGGNQSENKVQTASTASSLSTTNADTETTSVSATEKNTQNPTDSPKSNKDKKDRKIPKIKRTVRIIRRTVTVQLLKKVRNPSRVQATVLRIRKNKSSSSNSSSKPNKKNDVQPTTQDKYKTDPVPSGKPKPVEPEEQETKDTNLYCTFTITCSTILDNMDALDPEKKELVPKDGIILKKQKVQFKEGESVYDVLVKVCKDNNIHMESSWTPMYNSAYIEGINNLYEFDCGSLSGWMYKVNEWFPNYGCSRYVLKNGDDVVWCYTCNLGYDVGGGYATGE